MRLQGSQGALLRWEDHRMLTECQANVKAHFNVCGTCQSGIERNGTPAHAYEYSRKTWRLVMPERFCSQGRFLITEAARSGHLMLKSAI